jgi:hypothetical protein
MGAWRKIKTAPRDGTAILLGNPLWDKPGCDIGVQLGYWSHFNGCWQYEGRDALEMNLRDDSEHPTHWQPLPELPR